MKPENKNQKKTSEQSPLKTKLVAIGITVIGTLLIAGCQETSMIPKTSLLTPSPISEKVYTMVELSSNESVFENKTTTQSHRIENLHLLGTRSYVEKLRSMYVTGDLSTSCNRQERNINVGIPIVLLTF